MFQSTNTILQAAVTAISGLTLGSDQGALAGQPAFAAVQIYSRENLVAAMRELYLYADRLCVLVPISFRHEHTQDGAFLIQRRTLDFAALVTDRNYGLQATAFTGQADVNPGCLYLAEMLTAALAGVTLGVGSCFIRPENGEAFSVKSESKDLADDAQARACWAQQFKAWAGEVRAPIPKGVKAL